MAHRPRARSAYGERNREAPNAWPAIRGDVHGTLADASPKAYHEMRKDGSLNEVIQTHSKEGAEEVVGLMAKELNQHEAEETVMPDFPGPPEK